MKTGGLPFFVDFLDSFKKNSGGAKKMYKKLLHL